MADRQFRVVLTGDNAGIVGAARGATDALRGTGKEADAVGKKFGTASGAITKTGVSAAQTAAAMRQVPAQFTDIVTSLQAGQAPLTVLLQQGGQLKDAFGGVAPAARALGGYVVGLISPLTLAAAAAAAVGLGFYQAAQEAQATARAITLSGNAAGVTAGQVEAMAKSIGDATSTSTSSARATLQGLIADGRLAGEALTSTATVIQQLSKITGESTEDIAKEIGGLIDNVGGGAEKLNQKYHILTATELEHVKTLAEQGDGMRAVAEVMTKLSERASSLTGTMGLLAKASNLVNDVLNVFRATSTETAIDRVRKQIEFNESGPLAGLRKASTEQLKQQLAYLQEQERMERRSVEASTQRAAREQAGVAFGKLKEESLSRQEKMTRELAKANALADRAGLSQDDRKQVLDNIREKYKAPKGAQARSTAAAEAKADLQQQIDVIRGFVAAESDLYRSREDALRTFRSADLIGDQQYLDGLRVSTEAYLGDLRRRAAEEQAVYTIQKAKTTDKGERARLDEQATRSREKYADAVRDTTRRVDDAFTQSDIRAAAWARTQNQTNESLSASLITSTSARMAALAALDIADRRRQVDLLIEGTEARKSAEAALADYILLRNRQLADDLKPEWQRMLEGFRDVAEYMRKESDSFTTGFIDDGRQAFTQFVTTGKASVSNLVGFIQQQFAKMVYDQYLAKYAADLGGSIFKGLLGLIGGGSGVSTGTTVPISGASGSASTVGMSLAVGTNYVPYDGLVATLHKGEAVVPAEYNPAAGGQASESALHLTIAPVFHGGVTRGELAAGMNVATQTAVRAVGEARRRGNAAFVGATG